MASIDAHYAVICAEKGCARRYDPQSWDQQRAGSTVNLIENPRLVPRTWSDWSTDRPPL